MSSEEAAGAPYEEYEEEEEQQQQEEEEEQEEQQEGEYQHEYEEPEYEEEVYEEDVEENPYETHETAVDNDPFNTQEVGAVDYEAGEGEEEEEIGAEAAAAELPEENGADEVEEEYAEEAYVAEEQDKPEGEEEEEEQQEEEEEGNQVAALQAALNGEAELAEEEAAAAEEQEVALYSDYADPKLLIAEVHRVDESCMIIMRGLTSISSQRDDDLRVNLLDICADLQAEEEMLFSPMPDYVSRVLEGEKKRHSNYNRNVQPHPECRQSGLSNSNFSGERRAFVDPRIPLPMPYSIKRFKSQHPEREEARGTYHELFFGDRNSVEFKPPADNKRKQIEDKKKAHPPPERRERASFEPQPKPTKKVPADFVPSCANVDNSAAKKRLEQYKKYRRTYV